MLLTDQLEEKVKIHSHNTMRYAVQLAKDAGLDEKEIYQVQVAANLHDIGKLAIPEEILMKPGKLTEEERKIIMGHAAYGDEMLKDIFSVKIRRMVRYHHENEDGSGYHHLLGDQIIYGAKIIHICDVYDALASDRPYRRAWPDEEVLQYIREQSGHMFDPELTNIFLKMKMKDE